MCIFVEFHYFFWHTQLFCMRHVLIESSEFVVGSADLLSLKKKIGNVHVYKNTLPGSQKKHQCPGYNNHTYQLILK